MKTAEELALEIHPVLMEDGWDKNEQYREEWIAGYKAAIKLYTEEVLHKCWIRALEKAHNPLTEPGFKSFIESLKTQLK